MTMEPPVPDDAPLGAVRSCQECNADMLDGQDWCLNCGTAARVASVPAPAGGL